MGLFCSHVNGVCKGSILSFPISFMEECYIMYKGCKYWWKCIENGFRFNTILFYCWLTRSTGTKLHINLIEKASRSRHYVTKFFISF